MRRSRQLWLVALLSGASIASLRLVMASPSQQGITCAWERLPASTRNFQHSMVRVPGAGAIVFGGEDLTAKTVSDELRMYVRQTNSWIPINAAGSAPGKRAEHSAVLREVGVGGEMVTYGGTDELPQGGGTFTWQSPLLAGGRSDQPMDLLVPQDVQDGTYRLRVGDGTTLTWEAVSAAGSGPRAEHSAVWNPADDSMVVFGGRTDEDAKSATDTLVRLDMEAEPDTWQARTPSGARPAKRFSHSAIMDPVGQRMIVYGGTNDWAKGMNDLWALDLAGGWEAATWKELKPTGTAPAARFEHSVVYLPGLRWMVVFGGTTNGSRELSDIFALDLAPATPAWIKLNPTGQKPPALRGTALAALDDGVSAIFQGGQSGEDASSQAWRLVCSNGAPTPTSPPPTDPPTNTPPPEDTPTDLPPTATATSTSEPATATNTARPPTNTPPPTDTEAPEPRIFLPVLRKGE